MTVSNGKQASTAVRGTRRAVFLHTGWRTAGTWLWARFRTLPWVEAYYEPLHENLDSLTDGTILRQRADTSVSGHPALALPYYHEYAPLLRATGGVEGFHANFATEDFFADAAATLPALRAYLTRLVDHASSRGRYPVLKFCRSIGRVAWMCQVFSHAAHVVVLRNPAAQFESARRYLARQNNPYFLVMPLAILLRNQGSDRVADAMRLFDVRLPALPADTSWDDTLRACLTWIEGVPVEQWYRGFMAFWLLGVAGLPDTVDTIIDTDLLTLAPRYRATVRSTLVALTGLSVGFDDATQAMHLCDGIGVPTDAAWHCHQIAAMLLAARHGAAWPTTPIGGPIAGLLAHADLVATPDGYGGGEQDVDPIAYLRRLRARAEAAGGALDAICASHPWRSITPRRWVQDHLADAMG